MKASSNEQKLFYSKRNFSWKNLRSLRHKIIFLILKINQTLARKVPFSILRNISKEFYHNFFWKAREPARSLCKPFCYRIARQWICSCQLYHTMLHILIKQSVNHFTFMFVFLRANFPSRNKQTIFRSRHSSASTQNSYWMTVKWSHRNCDWSATLSG